MDIALWVALLFVWIQQYEWHFSLYGYSTMSGSALCMYVYSTEWRCSLNGYTTEWRWSLYGYSNEWRCAMHGHRAMKGKISAVSVVTLCFCWSRFSTWNQITGSGSSWRSGMAKSVWRLPTSWTVRGSNPTAVQRFFYPSRPSRQAMRPIQPSIQLVPGAKQPGRCADHCRPYGALSVWIDISQYLSSRTCDRGVLGKGETIQFQALTVPEGSRRLRLQDFKTIGRWKWQGCQPYAPAAFTPRKYSWYSFLLEAESPPGP
jgi:hypothetical protein